jgi:lipopolysaccharide/colanic/teichoic acid biosynthesis glycosyltransferase
MIGSGGRSAGTAVKPRKVYPASFMHAAVPARLFHRVAKRAFDVIAATSGLILLSPTFLLVSMAIKIESHGPVFCPQVRYDYDNKKIAVLKFRSTMFTRTGESSSCVTHVGRVLRWTGIDGLPQLINVLSGEMSIVGPQPCVTADQISAERTSLFWRPGITGWAQVNGYWGESDIREGMRRRLEYDLFYINNWSFSLDVKIILMTFFSKSIYVAHSNQ